MLLSERNFPLFVVNAGIGPADLMFRNEVFGKAVNKSKIKEIEAGI